MDRLKGFISEHSVKLAILTVPGTNAQAVTNQLVEAGIQAILNFSPSILQVPNYVVVNNVNLKAGAFAYDDSSRYGRLFGVPERSCDVLNDRSWLFLARKPRRWIFVGFWKIGRTENHVPERKHKGEVFAPMAFFG